MIDEIGRKKKIILRSDKLAQLYLVKINENHGDQQHIVFVEHELVAIRNFLSTL